MKPDIHLHRVVETIRLIKIGRKELLAIMNQVLPLDADIPKDASISIIIPSGAYIAADESVELGDIDSSTRAIIKVQWTEREENPSDVS